MSILLAVLGRWEERSDACTIPEYKWINEQFETALIAAASAARWRNFRHDFLILSEKYVRRVGCMFSRVIGVMCSGLV